MTLEMVYGIVLKMYDGGKLLNGIKSAQNNDLVCAKLRKVKGDRLELIVVYVREGLVL